MLDVYVTDNHDVIAFGRRAMSMGRLLLIRLFVSLDVKPKVYVLFFVPDNHVLPVSPLFHFHAQHIGFPVCDLVAKSLRAIKLVLGKTR